MHLRSRIYRVTCCAAFLLGSLTAAPIPGLFSSGVDANRAVLTEDAVDPHFRLVAPSPIAGTAFIATEAGGFPIPPWISDSPDSAWITPSPSTVGPNSDEPYTYETQFDLTGFDPATARIVGRWAADNQGVDIRLNGVSTGQTTSGEYFDWSEFSLSTGFVPGTNVIQFRLTNGPSSSVASGPTGLRVELSGTATIDTPYTAVPLLRSTQTLTPPSPQVSGHALGTSVALDAAARTIAVGAPGDLLLGGNAGTCFIYDGNGTTGTTASMAFVTRVDPAGASAGWAVGSQVAVNETGNWIAVRATPPGQGAKVFLFERRVDTGQTNLLRDAAKNAVLKTNWVQRTVFEFTNPEFGTTLQFGDGGTSTLLAVGSPAASRSPATTTGSLELYRLVNGSWSLWKTLRASDAKAGDRFGSAASFKGSTLAVGAPNAAAGRGSVYLFNLDPANDLAQPTAQASRNTGSATDRFGEAVALLTSVDLIVGAPGATLGGQAGAGFAQWFWYSPEDQRWSGRTTLQSPQPEAQAHFGAKVLGHGGFFISAPGAANGGGRAYYGEIRDDQAQLLATVQGAGTPKPGDHFGAALASSSADTIALFGAPGADNNGLDDGVVWISRRNNTAPMFDNSASRWTTAALAPLGFQYGAALASDLDTLVVGMPFERNSPNAAGAADVYRRQGDTWVFAQRLVGDPSVPHREFGAAVAVHGRRIAIGAPGLTGDSTATGSVFVYQLEGNNWVPLGAALRGTAAPGGAWGTAVVLDNDRVIIGQPGSAQRAGSLFLYRWESNWVLEKTFFPPDSTSHNGFGGSLALLGSWLAVGEPGGAGQVDLYERTGTSWNFKRSLSPSPKVANGAFGYALSFDASRLAVGQPDAGNGAVHLFSTSDWSLETSLLAANGTSGFGLALDLDGWNLTVGAPKSGHVLWYQWTEKSGWHAEPTANGNSLSDTPATGFGTSVATQRDRLIVGLPGRTGGGAVTCYEADRQDATRLNEYLQDQLYSRRNTGSGLRDSAVAAFRFRSQLYADAGDATERRVKIQPDKIPDLYGDAERERTQVLEHELLTALAIAHASGEPPAAVAPLENLLLDLYRDRAVAEALLARHQLRAMEVLRLNGATKAESWVIDEEIPGYEAIVGQDWQALTAYFSLFRSNLLPGTTDYGTALFQKLQATRRQPIPTYSLGATDVPVPATGMATQYADLAFVYSLLRDYAQHARTLAQLRFARGTPTDREAARTLLEQTQRRLVLHSAFLENLVPAVGADPETSAGLADVVSEVAQEAQNLAETSRRLAQGLTPQGLDREMLLLYQRADNDPVTRFNSYDSFRSYLKESGSPLDQAIVGQTDALAKYDNLRDRNDRFADQLALANTAYDNRLYDTWGVHLNDANFDLHPTNNYGGGIWVAWKSVEEAQTRLRRNQLEVETLRERIQIEIERRGRETAINNAIGRVRIRFANRQADLTETIGHIQAAQAGFDNLMESFSADQITKGGVVLGLIRGAGNAAAEEAKARFAAQKERLAGLEEAEVVSLEDRLLDANSRALVKNLLLDIQAALVDSEEASIELDRSLGEYQALVDEANDTVNRIKDNNRILADRYYADPIHALRTWRGFASANLAFENAQRWVFYLGRALEYKWNEPFALTSAGSPRVWNLDSVFKSRNASELRQIFDKMQEYDASKQLGRIEEDRLDYYSVRDHFFGYPRQLGDPKEFLDPVTGQPVSALVAFRSRLRQLQQKSEVTLQFQTARQHSGLFVGPEFCDSGLPKVRGTYLDKIEWIAIRLRVNQLPQFNPFPKLTGRLSYGGLSYVRNRRVGTRLPEAPDRIVNEMATYSVRRWFPDQPQNAALRPLWISEEGLRNDAIPMYEYVPSDPTGFGGVLQEKDLQESERLDFLKERPVAASDWRLTLPLVAPLNLDHLEDIEIYIKHRSAIREGPLCNP